MTSITKLSLKDVIAVYKKIKKAAVLAYEQANYNQCIKHVETAAKVAGSFNWIYTDDDLENILHAISGKIISNHDSVGVIKGRYVLYDFQALDNSCLTQQYLRALVSFNAEILYIPEKLSKNRAQSIINELSSYPKARIFEVNDSLSIVEKIKTIYNEIIAFKPEKIFMQLAPSSAMAVVLFNAFPNITKYFIDLTDHVFYLGESCADYFIEFRNRGCTVAIEKRQISYDRIFLLPYYPIISESAFFGFPSTITTEKVVVFSGGSFYKVYGEDGMYFKILKRLIKENPNVIVLFAGMGVKTKFNKFIERNKLQEKVLLLDFRKDINEVFRHCDIYLNTYPFSGGLMCQYAAVNGKPILAYNTENRESDFVETIICDNTDIKITHTSLDDLFEEAKRLIDDQRYRQNKGNELKDNLQSPEKFNKDLLTLISSNRNLYLHKKVEVDYTGIIDRCLYLQNNDSYFFKSLIIKVFRLKTIVQFPKVLILTLPLLLNPRIILDKLYQKK